ncbi:MAG: NTP transferase domain-containing protein [Phycisphaerales bacterium]|nr:NTP transferase domain-containing protein [Phycisphaerales bacterium]
MPDPQPLVLVGGRSRRFGRDKLREPFRGSMGGTWLVDQSILALRAVFGPRVWTVGQSDAEASLRGDRHLADRWPGAGPLGGILTALQESADDVFVLSGDLPGITDDHVRLIAAAAQRYPRHDVVIGRSAGPEPCIGIYRRSAIAVLTDRIQRGDLSLLGAVDALRTAHVDLPPEAVINANRPEDWPPAVGSRRSTTTARKTLMAAKPPRRAKPATTPRRAAPAKVPATYLKFIDRFPELGKAHEAIADAVNRAGPLDAKTLALIKIGICVGAGLESALRSHVRRAMQHGATIPEIEQAILLGMNTVGFPRTTAAWSWARVQFERGE